MPLHRNQDGTWQWGESGKKYKNKEDAIKQMKAIFASGYKEPVHKKACLWKYGSIFNASAAASSKAQTVAQTTKAKLPRYHQIQSGDTFKKLSKQYNIPEETLIKWNAHVHRNPNLIKVGQRVYLYDVALGTHKYDLPQYIQPGARKADNTPYTRQQFELANQAIRRQRAVAMHQSGGMYGTIGPTSDYGPYQTTPIMFKQAVRMGFIPKGKKLVDLLYDKDLSQAAYNAAYKSIYGDNAVNSMTPQEFYGRYNRGNAGFRSLLKTRKDWQNDPKIKMFMNRYNAEVVPQFDQNAYK